MDNLLDDLELLHQGPGKKPSKVSVKAHHQKALQLQGCLHKAQLAHQGCLHKAQLAHQGCLHKA